MDPIQHLFDVSDDESDNDAGDLPEIVAVILPNAPQDDEDPDDLVVNNFAHVIDPAFAPHTQAGIEGAPYPSAFVDMEIVKMMPNTHYTRACEWKPILPADADVMLFAAEGSVPYTREEGRVLLPLIANSASFSYDPVEDAVCGRYDSFHVPYLSDAFMPVDNSFFGLIARQCQVVYAEHRRSFVVFGYSGPPRFFTDPILEDEAPLGLPFFSNSGTICVYDDGVTQSFPAGGRWWRLSSCRTHVCVCLKNIDNNRGYFVLPVGIFLRLFVPWWRGGKLFLGKADPHFVVLDDQTVEGESLFSNGFNAHYVPLFSGSIVGASDNHGSLPLIAHGGEVSFMSFERSKWVVTAWYRAGKVPYIRYEAKLTDFDYAIPEPSSFGGTKMPLDVCIHISRIVAGRGRRFGSANDFIRKFQPSPCLLACGCSNFTSCSNLPDVFADWMDHVKIPAFPTGADENHCEDDWAPAGTEIMFHVFPQKLQTGVTNYRGDCLIVSSWRDVLCSQVEYQARIIAYTRLLKNALDSSEYQWEQCFFPWHLNPKADCRDAEFVVDTPQIEHHWNENKCLFNKYEYPVVFYHKYKPHISEHPIFMWPDEFPSCTNVSYPRPLKPLFIDTVFA